MKIRGAHTARSFLTEQFLPAGEALSAGLISCYLEGGTLKVRQADSAELKPADGFVKTSYAKDANVPVYFTGVSGLSGVTPGRAWLGSSGAVTDMPPAAGSGRLMQQVGVSLDATRLEFIRGDAFVRSAGGDVLLVIIPIAVALYGTYEEYDVVIQPSTTTAQKSGGGTVGDGDVITQIDDESGNLNHLLTTSGNPQFFNSASTPWNNQPRVNLDGFDWLNVQNKTAGNGLHAAEGKPFTLITCWRTTADGTFVGRGVSAAASRTFQALTTVSHLTFIINGQRTDTSFNTPDNGSVHVLAVRCDGAATPTVEYFYDNHALSSLPIGSASENTGEDIYVGCRTNGSFLFTGDIGRLYIASKAFSTATINAILNGLSTDFGLGWTRS